MSSKLHLCWTFECLHSKNLFPGHAKCVFDQTQVVYLGHIIGAGTIAVDPAKMCAIIDWLEPTCVKYV